jgi:hypothetical protein
LLSEPQALPSVGWPAGGILTYDALGNIGDFIGGIGVVVTLIYLAGQIRQNTRSVQVSAFHAAQRDVADILDSVASDPELTRIFFDGNRDYESLSRDDRRRYALCITSFLRKLESILHQTRLGTLEDFHGFDERGRGRCVPARIVGTGGVFRTTATSTSDKYASDKPYSARFGEVFTKALAMHQFDHFLYLDT